MWNIPCNDTAFYDSYSNRYYHYPFPDSYFFGWLTTSCNMENDDYYTPGDNDIPDFENGGFVDPSPPSDQTVLGEMFAWFAEKKRQMSSFFGMIIFILILILLIRK